MSTPYSPDKNGKAISTYAPSFAKDLMQEYTAWQSDSENISLGIATSTSVGKAIIDKIVTGVVGQGLTPMASPYANVLGWTKEQADKFQRDAETFWNIFTGTRFYDWYGKNSFKQIQQQALRNCLIYGDFLNHRGYRKLGSTVVPFVQTIGGNMVCNRDFVDQKTNRGGVLYKKGSDIEYGYEVVVIGDNLEDTYDTKKVMRYNSEGFMEFDLVVLGQLTEKTTRGIPLFNPVRGDILMLEKIKNNYLVKMSVQNVLALYLKQSENPQDTGISTAEKLMGLQQSPKQPEVRGKVDLGPGVIIEGKPGEEAQLLQAATQSADFAQLFRTILENISAACWGLPVEVLLSSFNASFSASRASINIAEKCFSEKRTEFIQKFMAPAWEQVVDYGIRIGFIQAPGYTFGKNIFIDKQILASTWTGVTPVQIDPVKEVNAFETAINLGICTREYAIRNLYGLDADEVFERIAQEQAKMEQLGISPTTTPIEQTDKIDKTDDTDEKEEDTDE